MSKTTTKATYIRLLQQTLEAIATTPKDNVAAFERLKAKAKKYVKKVESMKNGS